MSRINLEGLRRLARALRSPPSEDEIAVAMGDAMDLEWPPPRTSGLIERRRHALAKFDDALGAARQDQAVQQGSGREAVAPESWRAEVDAMFDRMQKPEFAGAAGKALDEPLRVSVPKHLRPKKR